MSIAMQRRLSELEDAQRADRQRIESLERRVKELEAARRRPAQVPGAGSLAGQTPGLNG